LPFFFTKSPSFCIFSEKRTILYPILCYYPNAVLLSECHLFAREQELNGEITVSGISLRPTSPEQISMLPFPDLTALGLPALEGIQLGIGQLITLA